MPEMDIVDFFRKLERRFWARVKKSDGCWEWQGHRMKQGYGVLSVKDKPILAHRLSYRINIGKIPKEKLVCHSCDNPPCVRPGHLWIGTNRQNMDDAMAKRRADRIRQMEME